MTKISKATREIVRRTLTASRNEHRVYEAIAEQYPELAKEERESFQFVCGYEMALHDILGGELTNAIIDDTLDLTDEELREQVKFDIEWYGLEYKDAQSRTSRNGQAGV